MRERALSLLPFYLNATLESSDRAWLEAALQSHAWLRAELEFTRQMQADVQHNVEKVPESIGLAKALARIEQSARPARAEGNFFSRWFDSWMKPALAVSFAVIAVQSVLLLRTSRDAGSESPTRYRGANSGTQVIRATTLQTQAHFSVIFQPTASEGQLRMLLAGAGAQIIAGPGLNGEYLIAVNADAAVTSAELLRQSELVQSSNVSAGPR